MLILPGFSVDVTTVLFLAAIAVAIWALVRIEAVARDVAELSRRVDALARILPGLAERVGVAPTMQPAPSTEAPRSEASPHRAAPQMQPPPQPAAASSAASQWAAFEESIASRWMIWAGGAAVALAGAFLVKYSMDHGWLGPTVRVTLGAALGIALIAAGEWVRQRPFEREVASIRPNHLPPAITAAGLFTCFASTYAAWALYDLLPPTVTFALLAMTSLGAVALALLQGPVVALLGVVASFATPMLVRTDHPSAIALFLYLLFPVGAALAIAHCRSWRFLAWTALAGASAWPLLWYIGPWTAGDALPIGLYLLLVAGMFLTLADRTQSDAIVVPPAWMGPLSEPERIAWGACTAVALLVFALVRVDDYGATSLATLIALSVAYGIAGRRQVALDAIMLIAAAAAVLLFAVWHEPNLIPPHPFDLFASTLTPNASRFLVWTAAFGALFGAGGFIALWGARRPALWAGVSAAAPVLLLVAAYARIAAFTVDFGWMAVALALALATTALASVIGRHREDGGMDGALAAYAAAAVAALSLACTFVLREAWLTVAFAIELPVLAWIAGRLSVPSLRWIAGAAAAVVLARLAMNPSILDYPMRGTGGFSWVLYGYGIPVLAFAIAARKFRVMADDSIVSLLYAGALIFFVLGVSFEIRVLTSGSISALHYGMIEESLHTLAWLGIALTVAYTNTHDPRAIWWWSWRILAWAAFANLALFHLVLDNPMITGEAVGRWPVFNLLFLAYAAPAALCIVIAQAFTREGARRATTAFSVLAIVLGFAYVTFEVAHAVHGPVISYGPTTDAQSYAYSLAWLVYGAALLGAGMTLGQRRLRQAGLAVVALVIVKVFLSDMSHMTGLYRVASFLGLGLGLLGISYLYQRFAFAPRTPPQA